MPPNGPSTSAQHGGASFQAIGENFCNLNRQSEVITADVLDAWFDPAPAVLERLREFLPFLARSSPPLEASGLINVIAHARGVPEDCVLPGAGSSSLLFHCLPQLIKPGSLVLRFEPTYSEYDHLCRNVIGANVMQYRLDRGNGFRVEIHDFSSFCARHRPDAVLLVNPNNPTGRLWKRAELERFLEALSPETLVLVDETYIDFASPIDSLESLAASRSNLIVVKSMSKVYALSGLRIGYVVADAPLIERLALFVPPWPVSLLGQVAAVEALRARAYYEGRWEETRELRQSQLARLAVLPGLTLHDTDVNWLLLEHTRPDFIAAVLRAENIFVREFGNGFLRIAIKRDAENQRIAGAIATALARLT